MAIFLQRNLSRFDLRATRVLFSYLILFPFKQKKTITTNTHTQGALRLRHALPRRDLPLPLPPRSAPLRAKVHALAGLPRLGRRAALRGRGPAAELVGRALLHDARRRRLPAVPRRERDAEGRGARGRGAREQGRGERGAGGDGRLREDDGRRLCRRGRERRTCSRA